ncbi:protocatechuate dioxygenase [Devosia yakushimensis]|uniref:Protocatechuate dioxygenase n=1 Tax=Devosia yakushimensis TaxID=470028 RepID=A0ABQ5U9X4_9HYPH|nr:intradiol ring-cleavage dioxygenase [Devosia yakushimensis]GLQ08443.1 protocatechuate dioxygenase [Devosia yakushimensis]
MTRINRRDAFRGLAITASGGLLMSQSAFAQEAAASASQTAALLQGADVCVIIPEVTEGPYYFDPAMERADITEGRPGIPTRLRLQVVDAACVPMSGARVDIWHCDASGVYSGYSGQGDDGSVDTTGETFMRGTQFTAENGIVEFETVYPSWYRGRTTHIHFKVFLDETNVLTGQIFFPDALSEYIYLNVAPYNDRSGARDTLNSNDSIAAQSTRAAFAFVKELEAEYLVAMIVGVDPTAQSAVGFGGGGRPAGGPPPDGAGGPPPGGGGPTGTAEQSTMTPPVKG